ncbi:hypothetical protein AYK26_01285 [Euryarchaeota archaeon SM23-78]|nr:MAG: hypothetical protein AYK26_01285 [Euryarchaeota archaeon SM23-78]MBW3000634.1 hypothetical protein [Candidatus Woesearchaeota archaeon]
MDKPLEILVIEDKEHHLRDAKELFNEKIASGMNIKVDYAINYEEAKEKLKTKLYDGILSDIFFPSGSEVDEIDSLQSILKEAERYTGEIDFEETFKGELPYGIMIAKYSLEKNIPCVLITDTYHHGEKTEPINGWTKAMNLEVPLIDRSPYSLDWKEKGMTHEELIQYQFDEKDWRAGYETLLDKIKERIG